MHVLALAAPRAIPLMCTFSHCHNWGAAPRKRRRPCYYPRVCSSLINSALTLRGKCSPFIPRRASRCDIKKNFSRFFMRLLGFVVYQRGITSRGSSANPPTVILSSACWCLFRSAYIVYIAPFTILASRSTRLKDDLKLSFVLFLFLFAIKGTYISMAEIMLFRSLCTIDKKKQQLI